MTKQELSQLFYLNREIEHLKNRIAELECAADAQAARITGMPKAPGFSNAVGRYAPEIAELKALLEANLRKCFKELIKLSRFIEGIESSQMRLIITLRYVYGLTWRQIALRIGEHDEQYPRRKHNALLGRSCGLDEKDGLRMVK